MIKRARTARDFLDTFHSSTLEHRSKGEESLLDVDFSKTFDYLYEINFAWKTSLIMLLHTYILLTLYCICGISLVWPTL